MKKILLVLPIVLFLQLSIFANETDEQYESSISAIDSNSSTNNDSILENPKPAPKTYTDEERQAFIEAIKKGQLSVVEKYIEEGIDVNFRHSSDNNTPLMTAACYMYTQMARVLIEAGADIHSVNIHGHTALIYAAAYGNTYIVKLLIEHGADMDVKTFDGWSALIFAARWGHLDTVKLLIESGVDVFTEVNDGTNAMNWAIGYGHNEVASVLRQAMIEQRKGSLL